MLFTATGKLCEDKSVVPNTVFHVSLLQWRNLSLVCGIHLKRGLLYLGGLKVCLFC